MMQVSAMMTVKKKTACLAKKTAHVVKMTSTMSARSLLHYVIASLLKMSATTEMMKTMKMTLMMLTWILLQFQWARAIVQGDTMVQCPIQTSFSYRLRSKLNNDLHFQFMQQAIKDVKEKGDTTLLCKCVTGLVFNWMSAKAGLKKHGERAWKALLKELCQLKDLNVLKAAHASALTEKQKKEVLRGRSAC